MEEVEVVEEMAVGAGVEEDMGGVGVGVGGSRLAWLDLMVIAGYVIVILAVGVWSSRRSQKGSLSGYFLASRNMSWIPVGGSLFASNIGSGHFIGLAGAGAASGVVAHGYEQAAIYGLLVLGWVFVPVYMSAGVYTMPEYLGMRFGGERIRVFLSAISLALYIFTKIAADLYAGALFIQLTLNSNSQEGLYLIAIALVVVAGIFTITGGLTTVVYTDLMQTVLMVAGSLVLAVMSINAVGGYNSLVERYQYATATKRAMGKDGQVCGEPPPDYMNLLRSGEHGYPWPSMTFGMAILQIWYWCTDQVIVQRTLASRSITHGKAGTVLAAYLKYLPLFIMVFPGMAARILFPDRVACADPEECRAICGSPSGCTNSAYIELVLNILPSGLRGLMLAVMMAALMSSLTSVFNSTSTIFTIDIWRLIRHRVLLVWRGVQWWCWGRWRRNRAATPRDEMKEATETEMVVVGRAAVLVLVVISVLWIPVIQNSGNAQLFDYMNTIVSTMCAPIMSTFVMAVSIPRVNEKGAFWGLMSGIGLGVIRFCTEFAYTIPPCGSDEPDPRPYLVKRLVGDVHYMYFSIIVFTITVTVAVCVSLTSERIPEHKLYRLTFWSRRDPRVRTPHHHTVSPRSDKKATDSDPSPTMTLEEPCNDEEVGCWQRVTRRVFGRKTMNTSTNIQPHLTLEEEARQAAEFLTEPPFWREVVNVNAVVCIALSTFVYGFYA